MPAISIIVPYFDRRAFIGDCVKSVLEQTFQDYEVIIVDDGSTQELERADLGDGADDGRIRIVRQENRGSGAARNRGIKLAEGKYILFLDSDDLLVPGALAALWNGSQDGKLDAVVGNSIDFSADGQSGRRTPRLSYSDALANAVEGEWSTGSTILKLSLNPILSEEKARLPWDMAEAYLRAMDGESCKIAYVDQDIVLMRQDTPSRLTVLYDHFDPHKAGKFWQEMKSSFALNDERRCAFDRQIFRYVLSLFHAGNFSASKSLFSSINVDRLGSYHWCKFLSPSWFARWGGIRMGLTLQHWAHQAKSVALRSAR